MILYYYNILKYSHSVTGISHDLFSLGIIEQIGQELSRSLYILYNYAVVMGCGAAEATGLGFVFFFPLVCCQPTELILGFFV